MSFITWIIIVLIVISIIVTVTEVGLRFAILEKEKSQNGNLIGKTGTRNWTRSDFSQPQLQAICGADLVGKTFGEL
jgi:hypothetical protein